MPASLHFILGFVLGVLWTVGCFVVQPVAKIKLASLVAFPAIPMPTILHVLIFTNLAILNAILVGPRLRSLGRFAKKMYLPTVTGLANPVASLPAFKTFVRHLSPIPVFNAIVVLSAHLYRAAVLVIGFITTLIRVLAVFIWNFASILNDIRIVPRLRSIARLVKERKVPFTGFKWPAFPISVVHLTVASLVILYRAAVFVVAIIVSLTRASALFIWDRISSIVGLVRSTLPARGKAVTFQADNSMVDDDDTDITLVDESGPQSPSKDTVISSVPPPSPICLSFAIPSSASANTVDLPAEDDTANLKRVLLKATVPAFVPKVQPQGPSIITSSSNPVSLNVSAPAFVSKGLVAAPVADEDARYAGLSASMWAPTAAAVPPVIGIKKTLTLRTPPPAFWSPGVLFLRISVCTIIRLGFSLSSTGVFIFDTPTLLLHTLPTLLGLVLSPALAFLSALLFALMYFYTYCFATLSTSYSYRHPTDILAVLHNSHRDRVRFPWFWCVTLP
ncbi:hypothetical protein C8R44DRAFT_880380 [Mycena epipterygia]|nr:hypothetical protein C8R44DRAFT_880380 [Mycena epipterygia]